MILQLHPSILVITPLGKGQALFIIDYGMHQNTCWVIALEENGIIKHFDCNDVIMATNYTYHLNTPQQHQYKEDNNEAQTIPLARKNAF